MTKDPSQGGGDPFVELRGTDTESSSVGVSKDPIATEHGGQYDLKRF
jgi:hypothetical protein